MRRLAIFQKRFQQTRWHQWKMTHLNRTILMTHRPANMTTPNYQEFWNNRKKYVNCKLPWRDNTVANGVVITLTYVSTPNRKKMKLSQLFHFLKLPTLARVPLFPPYSHLDREMEYGSVCNLEPVTRCYPNITSFSFFQITSQLDCVDWHLRILSKFRFHWTRRHYGFRSYFPFFNLTCALFGIWPVPLVTSAETCPVTKYILR